MSSVTIDLKYPITENGQTIRTVTLRRPRVADLMAMDSVTGQTAKTVRLVANLAEMSPTAVGNLDAEDYGRVAAELERFFGPGNG